MNGLEITVIIIFVLFAVAGYFTWFFTDDIFIGGMGCDICICDVCNTVCSRFYRRQYQFKTNDKRKMLWVYCGNGKRSDWGRGRVVWRFFFLPENIIKEITGPAGESIGGILEGSGIYDEIAEQISHYIIKGIAFFITLTLAGIIVFWISHVLNLVSHISLVQGPNKILGAAVGAFKGLVLVWLIFYIIELCGTSETGRQFLQNIDESFFLSFLYDHNILLQILRIFL